MIADYWRAAGVEGSTSYYISPNPRIVLFLDEGAAALELAAGATSQGARSGLAAIYVPITSRILHSSEFAHVICTRKAKVWHGGLQGCTLHATCAGSSS